MSLYAEYSAATRSSRISSINVLVVDPDPRLTSLLRKVLMSLGFGAIYVARDGSEAMRLLMDKPIDLAITDWEMTPVDGLGFLEAVRRSDKSPNKRLPVLMLTGKAKRSHVETARDAGATEFLVKPFTVRTLCDRIMLVIDEPRPFILSSEYNGPDRRRQQRPFDGGYDRRRDGLRESRVIASGDNVTVLRKGNEDVAIVTPDYSLKEKIGSDVPLSDIFSAENVAKAQRIIHHSRGDFLGWVASDLKALERALARLEDEPNHGPAEIEALERAAMHIKAQSGTFDYELASQVAESLSDLCLEEDWMPQKRLTVARKHLDSLYVIFQRNIQGTGGQMGYELISSLNELSRLAG